MRKKIYASLAVGALLLAGLSACSAQKGDSAQTASSVAETAAETEASSQESEAAKSQKEENQGGEKVVTAAIPSAWSDLFPLGEVSHYDTIILNQMYDPLVVQKGDGSFEGCLADSWTVNEASDEIVFKLNKEAKWQDGEDFTADDVLASFKMYSKKEVNAVSRYYLQFIGGCDDSGVEVSEGSIAVEAIDEDTVSIKLKKPMFAETFLSDLSKVYILAEHKISGLSPEEINKADTWASPMGTGAFIYESSIDGERMEFKSNANYFRGKPDMDRLVIRVVDSANIMAGLLNQEIDVVLYGGVPLSDWQLAKEQKHLTCDASPSSNYQMLIINSQKPYMTQKVRQAISMAINRKSLVDNLLQGEGESIVTPISSINPYYHQDVAVWYDPDEAKKLLEEEGFPFDQVMSFYVPTGNEVRIKAATLIAEDLKAVGIKTEIQQVDFSTLMDAFKAGDEDLGIVGSGGSMNPGESLEMLKGNFNFSKLPDDNEMVQILEKANSALTMEERKPLFNEFQEKVKEISPYAYLFTSNNLVVYNTRLSNITVKDFAVFNWSIHSWKVSN